MKRRNPFRIGLESARVNVVPMVVLWSLAVAIVLGYYFVPGVGERMAPIARWQERWGVWAALVNQVFFSGVVPTVFIFTVRDIRTNHSVIKAILQICWSGMWGVLCWAFFAMQGKWFGVGHDLGTLILKTAVDQFAWTVLLVSPLSSVFYLWLGCDFSLATTVSRCKTGFVRNVMLPNLVSGWCVWIPVIFTVYAFPIDLQIQIHGLVCALWTLLCRQIGKRVSA